MHPEVIPCLALLAHPSLRLLGDPVVAQASLGIPDTFFIFVVALVVFGPKRLPEIGKQIGKLVFEFRRASNDFKLQIEEELRLSDQQERQKQLETQAAVAAAATPVAMTADTTVSAVSEPVVSNGEEALAQEDLAEKKQTLTVQPPSSGSPVEAKPPNRTAEAQAETYADPAEPAAATGNGNHAAAEQSETPTAPEGTPIHHG